MTVPYRCVALILATLRVDLGRYDRLPGSAYREKVSTSQRAAITLQTVVVTDTRLQFLLPGQRGIARVRHNIDDRNSIQPNHLLKVDVPTIISVDIVHRQAEIGSVRVGFEDISPVGIWRFGEGDVQEDGAGA